MPGSRIHSSLCQIAITTLDVERSVRFYSTLLGFRRTGRIPIRGRTAAQLLEVPCVRGECYWLAGDPNFFQLELFRFEEPISRPSAHDPDDNGYNRIAIETADLDFTLNAVTALGAQLLQSGRDFRDAQRAFIRDPDGVTIELIRSRDAVKNPRVVGVAATVKDISEARRYYSEGFGLEEREPGATAQNNRDNVTVMFSAGPYWLELTQHDPTVRDAVRRGLTDQGLMNIALGVRKPSEFHSLYRNLLTQGHRSATDPVGGGLSHSVYIQNATGLSVELLQLPEIFDSLWGFRPPGRLAAVCQRLLRFGLSLQRQPKPCGSQA